MENGILRNFPEISQSDEVREDIEYEYSDDEDVYEIRHGPALRVFEISTTTQTFSEGVDYDLVTNDEGNFTHIDWRVGGSEPDDGETFVVDQEFRSVIARYLEAHDEQFDDYEDDLVDILTSLQIDNAGKGDRPDDELDRIGAMFGELGQRSARNNSDYRAYLKSVVDSFAGRGSRSGLKFAIAAAVGAEPDNVQINENVEELSYTIVIEDVDSEFISRAVNDLAELADPSGVELDEAIITVGDSSITITGTDSSISSESTGLGGGTLSLDGTEGLGGFAITSNGDAVPQ